MDTINKNLEVVYRNKPDDDFKKISEKYSTNYPNPNLNGQKKDDEDFDELYNEKYTYKPNSDILSINLNNLMIER